MEKEKRKLTRKQVRTKLFYKIAKMIPEFEKDTGRRIEVDASEEVYENQIDIRVY